MRAHLFLVTLLFIACSSFASQLIPANHKHLQYSGRVDFSEPAKAGISWPATQVIAVITGNDIGVTLDDQLGKNYFNVFIDDNWNAPYVIECEQGLHTYELSKHLGGGQHKITLTKRTEGEEGRTVFHGFTVADGAKVLPAPPKPQRKIEFFGDSITSGMGNEAAFNGDDALVSEKNSFLSYAAITARALNAEYHITSQSGIGVMVSWFDFIMPQFYDQLDAVGNNDTEWDFNQWQPDVVVVNLFQNDSWLVEKRLDPIPNETERVTAYQHFIGQLRQVYPKAMIIAALGSMDATKPGSPWPGYIEKAVSNHAKNTGDKRIATFFLPFEDYLKHPRVVHHQKNAALLTAFIRERMNW